MSSSEIERFWASVSSNPALKAALPANAAADQVAAFATANGFEVTEDDVRQYASGAGELSEAALDAVAGGGDMPPQDPIDIYEKPPEYPPEGEPTDPNAPPEGEFPPPEGEEPPPEEPKPY